MTKSLFERRRVGRVNCRVGLVASLILLGGCDAVWKPIDPVGRIDPTPQAIPSQTRTVKFKLNRLTPPFNGRITLDLPGDEEVVARKSAYEDLGDESFVWRGRIKGPTGGFVMFSAAHEALIGTVSMADGRIFYVRSIEDNAALVEQLDGRQFPDEEAAPTVPLIRPGMPGGAVVDSAMIALPPRIEIPQPQMLTAQSTAQQTIGVLVLYTDAAAGTSTHNQMKAIADGLISNTNDAFRQSKLNQEVKLSNTQRIGFVESGSIWADLRSINDRHTQNGDVNLDVLDEIDGWRTGASADVVVLLTRPATAYESCGVANPMNANNVSFCKLAFAVVPVTCGVVMHSFAHELGHIMGAGHMKWGGGTNPIFAQSHGFAAASQKWRTIMTYPGDCAANGCQRVLVWSNARSDVKFKESDSDTPEATGGPSNNNATSLDQTAENVAGFSDECNTTQASNQ